MAMSTQILKHCAAFQMHDAFLAEHICLQLPPISHWNIVTNMHYFWHPAKQAIDLNPRMSWCYANEDFVGKIATIGTSCRHGQVAACRSKSLMNKYILGVTLRMVHAHAP